ncbi:MAG: hypothetical protein LBQ43_02035 [Holosporales bacterium]|nr:hypothetical protein [Holosporales bacterium]
MRNERFCINRKTSRTNGERDATKREQTFEPVNNSYSFGNGCIPRALMNADQEGNNIKHVVYSKVRIHFESEYRPTPQMIVGSWNSQTRTILHFQDRNIWRPRNSTALLLFFLLCSSAFSQENKSDDNCQKQSFLVAETELIQRLNSDFQITSLEKLKKAASICECANLFKARLCDGSTKFIKITNKGESSNIRRVQSYIENGKLSSKNIGLSLPIYILPLNDRMDIHVYKYLDAPDLSTLTKDFCKGKVSKKVLIDAFEAVAETITKLNKQNFIHGDLHSCNILYDLKKRKVRILDCESVQQSDFSDIEGRERQFCLMRLWEPLSYYVESDVFLEKIEKIEDLLDVARRFINVNQHISKEIFRKSIESHVRNEFSKRAKEDQIKNVLTKIFKKLGL